MNNSWNRIWKSIHIIGKTFDPNADSSKQSFVCFFACLADLLPDSTACQTLSSFIKQYPIEKNINSNEKAFEWTYKLHSYVNLVKRKNGQLSSDISFDTLNKNYSHLTKSDWADPIWFLIHYIAANLPNKLSHQQMISFKAFIVCLRYLLPCSDCRIHMAEYISNTEIDPYLKTKDSVFYWTWNFHNSVNKRINRPMIKIEDAYVKYRKSNNIYTMIEY
jgi:hypothetical protein